MSATEAGVKRPNVVICLMDDMGYSDPGCYGGEIETPHLDRLAEKGLRYLNFYNTGRCWPTRSSLLTGYYAPQVHMDPPEGREKDRPTWQRLLPHYLRQTGYRSYHSGKWHMMNVRDPRKEGEFDIDFGGEIEQGKHFFGPDKKFSSTAVVDHALDCLRDHQANHAEKPFFQYVCFTAPHFPVQAEQADIDKYMKRFDEGWDVMRQQRYERMQKMGLVNCPLSKRDPTLGAPWFKPEYGQRYGPGEIDHAAPWDSLTDEQKRFQATKMAIHAAMVDRTDREIGRLIDQLQSMGVYEDTLIFFLSDNGCSAEIMIRAGGHDPDAPMGAEETHLCLGPGWSTHCNTPHKRHKIWVNEGGVATPLIAHWPNGIKAQGELRHDTGHVIDFLPTILELAGVATEDIPLADGAPPLPGRSLVPSFTEDRSIERDYIYFNHSGNRALRMGDWKIVSGTSATPNGSDDDAWELYDLSTDRCEMNDLADAEPERLQEMIRTWEQCENAYRDDGGYTK